MSQPVECETLVIGASAAGLAISVQLRRRGRSFDLLEAEDVVAGAWRHHYDRLHLHTPKAFSALPGLRMPRAWPRYPSREQVVAYLENYGQHFNIQPRFGQRVTRLQRVDDRWVATTDRGSFRSDNVVVATGRTRVPVLPTWPVFVDGSQLAVGTVILATGYRAGVGDFLTEWESVCDSAGTPIVSGRPTSLPGLYFCGMHVVPSGMLREIGIEATRIAADIEQRGSRRGQSVV
jgi:indole-3-pyruvate monooxygenase